MKINFHPQYLGTVIVDGSMEGGNDTHIFLSSLTNCQAHTTCLGSSREEEGRSFLVVAPGLPSLLCKFIFVVLNKLISSTVLSFSLHTV